MNFLKNKYAELKQSNTNYSIRSFAQRAGISPGAMSEILNGKRAISVELTKKMADRLGLNPTERSQFLGELIERKQPASRSTSFLSIKQFSNISDNSYFSLLALIETSNFKNDIAWISQRLRLKPEQVEYAMNRLKQMNLITETEGKLVKTKEIFSTLDDVRDDFIQRAHRETLQLALDSLLRDAVSDRDFTSFAFPTDPKQLPKVKERIRQFQDEIAELMEPNSSTEVYKLAIQFFPLTKKGAL